MRRTAALLVPALVILGSVAVATPAAAVPISYAGTTIDVVLQPSGTSTINGGTAYLPESGGAVVATLGAALGSDVLVTFASTGGTLGDCTITAGTTSCGDTIAATPFGTYSVTTSLTTGSVTTPIAGTLIVVDNVQPQVALEWQDASGAWVDGSGVGLPFFQGTAARCVVTNVSNAPFTFLSFSGSLDGTPVPITGSLAAGETAYYPLGAAALPDAPSSSASCSGSIQYPDSTGSGNGTGGGAIFIDGSIELDGDLEQGATVTVSGEGLVPPIVATLDILFDGEPVDGSPVTVTGPDFDFELDVEIPTGLTPGTHALTVAVNTLDRDIVYAYFPLEVPAPPAPALAATGSEPLPWLGGALAVLLVGAGVLVARRRAV